MFVRSVAIAFLMANDNRDRAASVAEIPERKIDSPAPTRGMLFLAA
jgi:hypothetical protein